MSTFQALIVTSFLSIFLVGDSIGQNNLTEHKKVVKIFEKDLNIWDESGYKLTKVELFNNGVIKSIYESDPKMRKPRFFWLTKKSFLSSLSSSTAQFFKNNKIVLENEYWYKGENVGGYTINIDDY